MEADRHHMGIIMLLKLNTSHMEMLCKDGMGGGGLELDWIRTMILSSECVYYVGKILIVLNSYKYFKIFSFRFSHPTSPQNQGHLVLYLYIYIYIRHTKQQNNLTMPTQHSEERKAMTHPLWFAKCFPWRRLSGF